MIRLMALFSILTAVAIQVHADKMDLETHNIVIDKLEMVLRDLSLQESARVSTSLRLADLYADRARMAAMAEVEANCDGCKNSGEDRRRALALYDRNLNAVDTATQGRIMLQMAHLYDMLDQPEKSRGLLQKIIVQRQKYEVAIVSKAYVAMADKFYAQNKFKLAYEHYQKGAVASENPVYVQYRMAWSLYNQGQGEKAIQVLLKVLNGPTNSKLTAGFREEMARDLVTFCSHGRISDREIRLIYEYTPAEKRKENLKYLALETERLGKSDSSLVVWRFYSQQDLELSEKLEAHFRVAKLEYQLGKKASAVASFAAFVNIWKKENCDSEVCVNLKAEVRKFVLSWDKSEKTARSKHLIEIYALYTSILTEEMEVFQWAASAAHDAKEYSRAVEFYQKSALIAKDDKKGSKILEGSLLGQMESAEASKSKELRQKSYEFYLKLNPQGEKSLEARYQLAHLAYENEDYGSASQKFYAVATSSSEAGEDLAVRKKAADLALDSLALAKQNQKIDQWSGEFAKAFPSARTEYLAIQRKALLNQSAEVLNNSKSSRSEMNTALLALGRADLKDANLNERVNYFKNRYELALRVQDYAVADAALVGLMSVAGVSEKEKENALKKRIWLAELRLDFRNAYQLSLKEKHPKASEEKRQLRLSMLAELAGVNPTPHYRAFLNSTRNTTRANTVRAKMVLLSAKPNRSLREHLGQLKKNPEILGPLALEVVSRTQDMRVAELVLKQPRIAKTVSGRALQRTLEIPLFLTQSRQLTQHRLQTKTTWLLKSSLDRRLKLLSAQEKLAKRAQGLNDWTLKLLSLSTLSNEYKRLYEEIRQLPVPRGLNADQQKQYVALLEQQARPYLVKYEKAKKVENGYWSDSQSLNALCAEFVAAKLQLRNITARPLIALQLVAPSSAKSKIDRTLQTRPDQPSEREIAAARNALRQDPLNEERIAFLKELEMRTGRDVMVAYLDSRLQEVRRRSP